ncbi:MAG: HlyD family secretion protein, partial [Clostridia bacterium]|nr:HlyD family secretion protein [Clostridia bacterium]
VERGELLFETVEGNLDGLYAMDNHIVSGVAGIIASVDATPGGSVDKSAKLITIYPEGTLQIEVLVSEMDLESIHEGDTVDIEYEWDTDGRLRTKGRVSSISHVDAASSAADHSGASSKNGAQYSALIDFEATGETRIGMSVIVYADGASEFAQDEMDSEDEIVDED